VRCARIRIVRKPTTTAPGPAVSVWIAVHDIVEERHAMTSLIPCHVTLGRVASLTLSCAGGGTAIAMAEGEPSPGSSGREVSVVTSIGMTLPLPLVT
jgi:hypothetical protein